MTRSFWAGLTAALLAVGAAIVFVARWYVLGFELDAPPGESSWRVTLKARGELRNSSLALALPLDFRRQHIFDEQFPSPDLMPAHREQTVEKVPGQREMTWRRTRPGGAQPFELIYSFRCVLGMAEPSDAMKQETARIDSGPVTDRHLKPTPLIQSDAPEIAAKVRELPTGADPVDQIEAFYDHVAGLRDDPSLDSGIPFDELPPEDQARKHDALACLRDEGGDPAAKARLLVALCRNRGIPARVVTGLALSPGQKQALHHWAEAWVNGFWFPMDAAHGHFGPSHLPPHYLVLRFDDTELIRGTVGRPRYAYFVQELSPFDRPDGQALTPWQKWALRFSFFSLQPPEQQLVRFLLLLPLAALVVSVYRTLIGVRTFGTFSPALLGLAFLDLKALPAGLSIFLAAVLVGWGMRHVLDRYRLLLVPRTAILLTLIVLFLIGVTVVGNLFGLRVTHYLALFPLVILTHLVERFWTLEAEDGTVSAFKTLFGTALVAVTISLTLNIPGVSGWMVRYPESVGLILAALLLLGRYGGYRLTELYRFRDLIILPPATAPARLPEPAPLVAAPSRDGSAPVAVAAPPPEAGPCSTG
jgi:hypothetical protein